MKALISIVLVAILLLQLCACSAQQQTYAYVYEDGSYEDPYGSESDDAPEKEKKNGEGPTDIDPNTQADKVGSTDGGGYPENLLDKTEPGLLDAYFGSANLVKSSKETKTLYIPCEPNTVYSVVRHVGAARTFIGVCDDNPKVGSTVTYLKTDVLTEGETEYRVFTTPEDAAYLLLYFYNSRYDESNTEAAFLKDIKIYPGSILLTLANEKYTGTISEDLSVNKYGIFGISFSYGEEDITIRRTLDSDGLQYRQQIGNSVGYSDFDKAFPWCEMRECNIITEDGGRRIIYAGEPGFSRSNDTFIEIPAFYFSRTVSNGAEEWAISGEPFEGAVLEPWFMDADGQRIEYRYIAKYEGAPINSGHVSVSGVIPDTKQGIEAYREHCEDLGFGQMSIEARMALTHLMLIEIGSFNLQQINQGISYYPYSMDSSNWNRPQNTGETSNTAVLLYDGRWPNVQAGDTVYLSHTDSQDLSDPRIVTAITFNGTKEVIVTFDGEAYQMIEDSTWIFPAMQPTGKTDPLTCGSGREEQLHGAFLYRGIENPYGNVWEFVEGVKWNYSTGYFDIHDKASSIAAPYQKETGSDEKCGGWIKTLGYDPSMPWLILPAGIGASKNTFITDEWNTLSTEDHQIMAVGGGWDHQSEAGIFNCRTSAGVMAVWLYGYRAML